MVTPFINECIENIYFGYVVVIVGFGLYMTWRQHSILLRYLLDLPYFLYKILISEVRLNT